MRDAFAIPPTACCGPCNSRWRRAENQRIADGTPHDLTARAGNPVWCDPCTRHLRSALADLPELAVRLQLEIEYGSARGGEHVSGSRERPIHQHQAASMLIDDIAGVLAYWSAAVREDRELAEPPKGRPRGAAITADTRILLAHFDWMIAEHPEPAQSAEFGSDTARVHRRAAKLTHTDEVRPERCDGIPCSRCDLMMLEHEVDWQGRATGYVVCRNCETLLNAGEYDRWVKLAAQPWRKRDAA